MLFVKMSVTACKQLQMSGRLLAGTCVQWMRRGGTPTPSRMDSGGDHRLTERAGGHPYALPAKSVRSRSAPGWRGAHA